MAATKSAGRVSIRVLPDSTRFKRDLETSLRRIERQMVAKIRVELTLTREQLVKLKRQIESLLIKIKPTIELNITPEQLAELKAKIEAMRPKVDVELNTVQASRRIASLTRTRNLVINTRVLGLNSLATKLGAMSGFNVLMDTFRAGGQFISNIDRNAVKIARMSTLVAGAFASIVGLLGGLGLLVNDLAKLGNIAILGPAFGTGLAIGITTLVLALKDMKTVLADLGPRFTDLQNKMSKKFWDEAEKPVRSLVDKLFPTLSLQLQETSRLMGSLFGEVARSVEANATPERVTRVFGRMNEAIDISRQAIAPLTRALINLGDHGSKYFSRFSTWIVTLSNRFDKFIADAAADGRLEKWTEDAIQGFKDLGRWIASTTGVFGSIGRAARNAGYGGLSGFADSMERIDRIMNAERFQRAMTSVLGGLLPTLEGIKRGFIRLGPAIESALPTYERVMRKFGSIFEQTFGFIATFLENPELQKGVDDFVTGIDNAMRKLGPAMDPLATSLGGVLTLMGDVVERVAGLIADMAIKLGPEFDKVLLAITPLLDPLNKLASSLIDYIKPVLSTLATDVLPPLVTYLSQVFPWIDKIVGVITPVAVYLLEQFGGALKTMLESLTMDEAKANRVLNFLDRIGDNLSKQKFKVPDLGGGNTAGGLGQQIAFKFAIALGQESVLAREYLKWLGKQTEGIKNASKTYLFIQEAVQTITDPVKLAKALATTIKNLKNFFRDLGKSIDVVLEIAERTIKKKFQETFKRIFGFGASGKDPDNAEIKFGGTGAGAGGKGMGVGAVILPASIDEAAELSWIDTFNENVNKKLGEFWTGLGENLTTWGEGVKTGWNEFWGGLGTKVAETWEGMLTWIDTKKTEIKTSVDTWIGEVKTNWDNFWNGLGTKVQEAWQGFLDWIELKKTEIKTSIDTWITEVRTNWDTFWNGLGTKVQVIWQTFVNWINMKAQEIRNNIDRFIGGVQQNWNNFWNTVGTILRVAWDMMIAWIRIKIDEAVAWVKSLPGKAKAALVGMSGKLKQSGRNLIGGFIKGMGEMLESAKRTASTIMQAIRNFFPSSPAKEGPFSGMGYTPHSGRALVKDFADGMMSNMNKVRSATRAVAEAAHLGSQIDSIDLDQDGVVIDRRQVNIHNYNPVAEPASRTIEKAANQLRMAKGL